MSELMVVVVALASAFTAVGLLAAGGLAFIAGDVDAQYPDLGRSDDTLLYGPVREFIYQFAYARGAIRRERIKQIKRAGGKGGARG